MKRIKGLMATMLILTILVGSVGVNTIIRKNDEVQVSNSGSVRLLEDPDPVKS